MRRVFLLALAVALLLSGCRGGGWVFKGFHKDQDRALLERLGEKYPQMEFSCTGQSEGAVHQVLAGDGTQFPAWTAPGSKGKFQIIEHYLEEWLAAQGFYTALEEKLTELGLSGNMPATIIMTGILRCALAGWTARTGWKRPRRLLSGRRSASTACTGISR